MFSIFHIDIIQRETNYAQKRGEAQMGWYVYILRCGDDSLYTGTTGNPRRRLAAHRSGKGAKYTRGRGPLQLVYLETLPDRPAALRREWQIKQLSRPEKLALVKRWEGSEEELPL